MAHHRAATTEVKTILLVGDTGNGKSTYIKATLEHMCHRYEGRVLPNENATPVPDPTPARAYTFTDGAGRPTTIIDQNGTAEGEGADIRNVDRGIRVLRGATTALSLVAFVFNATNVKLDAPLKALLALYFSTFGAEVLSKNFAVIFTHAHGQTRERAMTLAAAFTAELESFPGVRIEGGCVRFWQVELHPSADLRNEAFLRLSQEAADAMAAVVDYGTRTRHRARRRQT